jgi:hypothetical protein
MVNVDIRDNTANHGGGVELDSGSLEPTNATVHGTVAATSGGGIDAYAGALTMRSSTLTDNEARAGDGGGLSVGTNMAATLSNGIIAGNTSGRAGFDAHLEASIANEGGLIIGSAVSTVGAAADPGAPFETPRGLFAATAGDGGAGIAQNNGGYGMIVALHRSSGNAATSGAAEPAGAGHARPRRR